MNKHIVIITGPGFEDVEVVYPYYRLGEAGYQVDIVTSSDIEVKGKHGVPMSPTIQIKNLTQEFDACIIPGGHEAPDRVRQVPEIIAFLRKMHTSGKIISSTCHGPWVLIEAGLVKGKHVTCYKGMKTDLINAGGLYEESPVVVDGNLVTSDHPRNMGFWMKETIRLLV